MNNDLISRSALKEKAETVTLWNGDVRRFVSYETIDNAPTVEVRDNFDIGYVQGLEDGQKRPQGEWIPVSEKLPERYKEVIVTDIETTNTYQSRYIGNGYWECDNGTLKNRIIAWQELPRPYKEKEE